MREGYIYHACLPSEEDLIIGRKGIFAAWKDPFPVYVYYNLDILDWRSTEVYKDDKLLMKHIRMDIVECKDPDWMGSNTFYPRGVLCGRDPSGESCFDSGNSGSGLMIRRRDYQSFASVGPLSCYRGCDYEGGSQDPRLRLSIFKGENPGVFTNGSCYLNWIEEQYEMVGSNTFSNCDKTSGDIHGRDKKDCYTNSGQKCDFDEQIRINSIYSGVLFPNTQNMDERNLIFRKCQLRSAEGNTNKVNYCPIDQNTIGVCPNNCIGSWRD